MLGNLLIILIVGVHPIRINCGVSKPTGDITTKASSEIIGSSVVTSVSVVVGADSPEEQATEPFFPKSFPAQSGFLAIETDPLPFPSNNFVRSLSTDDDGTNQRAHLVDRNKAARKEEGVQNVIDTLKNIVQEEKQKHEKTPPTPTQPATTGNTEVPVQPVDESPPTATTQQTNTKFLPGTSLTGDDDDEVESTVGSNDPAPPTTDAINDFAKHVISINMPPEEQDGENDTASSAEVHDAIHKISGAILSVEGTDAEFKKKPIENIVTEVLTSINAERNGSSPDITNEDDEQVQQPEPSTAVNKITSTTATSTIAPPPKSTKPSIITKKGVSSASGTVKKGQKKPSVASTTTTKKPQRQSQTTNKNNGNKVKTEMNIGSNNKNHRPTAPPKKSSNKRPPHQKVELPTIIMLETGEPEPSNEQGLEKADMPVIEKGEGEESQQDMKDKDKIQGIPTDEDPFENEDGNSNKWKLPPRQKTQGQQPQHVPIEYTTLRPYVRPTTKVPDNIWFLKRPTNDSSSSKRPNEFYDDEIFGYDPYQTFFHGVYQPVMSVSSLSELQHQEQDDEASGDEEDRPPVRATQRPNRPATKKEKPMAMNKKPMPSLPDHLHRPRPSHLQYQHGAVDDTDPKTGLLNAHYDHPGHSFVPDSDTMLPDKFSPNSKPLPADIRKNFTEHHDHHIQHQHGVGGGHGHGHGHDGQGHGDHGHGHHLDQLSAHLNEQAAAEKRPSFSPAPTGNPGLEASLTSVDQEKRLFVDINNRIALRLFSSLTNPVSQSTSHYGNMVISPFTVISALGMLFLGARGQTAAQLDGLLQMDDMLTFNPHMMYHNVTESFLSQSNTAAAIIRLLVTDKEKGDVLEFYKTRVQHFYEARVEEVDYKFAGHLAQSIINQMIRAQIQRHSYEMLNYSLPLTGPMSLITSAFFDGQLAGARDLKIENMNFIHLAALNQGPAARRLFQVPAVAIRGRFRAVFDRDLDATAVELPYVSRDLSLILIMPGRPGEFAFGGVTALKSRLNLDAWTKLMRGFYPRDNFKVILPRFRHQTSVNLSHTLNRFGLTDLFEPTLAKFKGINGLSDLHIDKNLMHYAEFGTWEKLSDTLTETNRNLDLIKILRPHVREHYGNFGEPMSVNEWIFKTRNREPTNEQRSQPDSAHIVPDDVSRLRIELERLKRRQQSPDDLRSQPTFTSYSKVRGSSLEFRPRRLKVGIRTQRGKNNHYFRQEETSTPSEQESVLRFERPFIYALRHNPTGMILMTGQYTEPVTEVLE